jgi:adenine-specific DNA-methyltransferase
MSTEATVDAEQANLPERLDLRSENVVADRRAEIIGLFPEVATEGGKVDFDQLKRTLGEQVDAGKERYGMTWPGKADCFKAIQTPSMGTLLPNAAQSVKFDVTENLILDGDNLEVLKLLQKSYLGKVKMIYIDPPYNTGNDFIYPDNYAESLQTYLEYTGQVDPEGRKFSTNSDADGRFHSRWLTMMFPRLYLSRNLLRDDGIMFVSIDDHELQNLRLLMNEIFGEESFLGMFVWQSKKGGGSDNTGLVQDQEYVLAYGRASNPTTLSRVLVQAEELDKQDAKGPYRRGRELNKWGSNSRREDRPTMWFAIPGPDGSSVYPIRNDGSEGRWRWGKKKMFSIVDRGDVEYVKRADSSFIVYEKIRSTDPRFKPYRTWLTDVGTTADGSKEVKDLFDGRKIYDYPKPVALLKHLVRMGTVGDTGIVLDFFAGSGTTAQAVLEMNADDSGDRTFICIQLPEPTGRDDYPTIADICKERVRRVIEKQNAEDAGQLDLEGGRDLDRGFRVFKLTESNFSTWNAQGPEGVEDLEQRLELHVDHVREGRSDDDLLYEILLKSGFPLATKVQALEFSGKTVFSVADGALLVCLDRGLTLELIREIAQKAPERVVCLDEGFARNDQLKANAVQIFKTKGINSFKTV